MESTMTHFLLGGAVLAAMVAIAPAGAQPAQPAQGPHAQHMQHGAPVAAPTRAQLGAHVATIFQRLDANRDGFITREESQAAMGPRGDRKGERQSRADRSPEHRTENRAAMFDRLDANRDGSLSRAEFAAAPARHNRRIEGRSDEHPHGKMGMGGMGLRGRMFEMADANRDGRVTMAEASAAAYRHFDMADANRDGQITRDERMQMRQRMRAAKASS
jgi:hypothetical protein